MRVLSLFSGGGLGDYGLELAGMEIVGQVEIDDYCQKILALRWPHTFKLGDIKQANFTRTHEGNINVYDGQKYVLTTEQIDLISGGFPCQDISTAGRGAGITGERSGLWKEMLRIIREVRPRYVLVESVTALLGRGLGVVLGDLAESGFDTEWDCLPACAFGGPHIRDRVFVVAYPRSQRREADENFVFNVVDPSWSKARMGQPFGVVSTEAWLKAYSDYARNDDGCTAVLERGNLLGNGQDVRVVQWIGERIMEFHNAQSHR